MTTPNVPAIRAPLSAAVQFARENGCFINQPIKWFSH